MNKTIRNLIIITLVGIFLLIIGLKLTDTVVPSAGQRISAATASQKPLTVNNYVSVPKQSPPKVTFNYYGSSSKPNACSADNVAKKLGLKSYQLEPIAHQNAFTYQGWTTTVSQVPTGIMITEHTGDGNKTYTADSPDPDDVPLAPKDKISCTLAS